MALFQSSAFSSFLRESETSPNGTPLADSIPSAQACVIPQLIAFPSSLAALRLPVIWNASCWVTNQRLDEFEQQQIAEYAFRGQQRTPHIEWCHFASDEHSNVSLLVVFPELKASFRSPEVMQQWTDQIVLPAFNKFGIAAGVLLSSFNIIHLAAEAEREQTLNANAPDTTINETLTKKDGLRADDLHSLWFVMQEIANNNLFWGFRNIFLVATCRQPGGLARPLPMDEAWRSLAGYWDLAIDMTYVPLESVKASASVVVSALPVYRHPSSHPASPPAQGFYAASGDGVMSPDTARKRKADRGGDFANDKRTRSEYEDRAHLIPFTQTHNVPGPASSTDVEMES